MDEYRRYEFERRMQRPSTHEDDGDDDTLSEVSSWTNSRPTTRDSINFEISGRSSTDSGAGSLDDFNRVSSTPLPTTFLDFWDGVRRHTAPPRKPVISPTQEDTRPYTVHAWNVFPSRGTMSRYTPLPAIGTRMMMMNKPPRFCFQEPDDPPNEDEVPLRIDDRDVEEQEDVVFRRSIPKVTSAMVSLSVDSEFDSDFDEESESCILYASEDEDEDGHKPKKPIVRTATFTIEDRKQEPRFLLAVRLPDGSRVSGQFNISDPLRKVCSMALHNYDDHVDKYELVTTEVPKRIFSDFSMSLQEAGLADKTLLNLQICDSDDSS